MHAFYSLLVATDLSELARLAEVRPVVRNHANANRPDLIVLGKHGRSRLADMILGSVTRDAIDQTDCDVLLVPASGSA